MWGKKGGEKGWRKKVLFLHLRILRVCAIIADMGFFSFGDFIVLLIAVLVAVVSRYAGRSEHNVKNAQRFGEKIKSEMAALAEKQKADLKASESSLRVEVTRASAALEKMKTIQKSVSQNETRLEDLDKRVTNLTNAFKYLDTETVAVNENLIRIRDEGGFVSGVSAKLDKAKKTFQQLESLIENHKTNMEGRLEIFRSDLEIALNSDAKKLLEDSQARSLLIFREEAATLTSQFDERADKLASVAEEAVAITNSSMAALKEAEIKRSEQLARDTETIDALREDALKNAAERAGEYEEEIFKQLASFSDEKNRESKKVFNEAVSSLDEMAELVARKLNSLDDLLNNTADNVREKIKTAAEEEEHIWNDKMYAIQKGFEDVEEKTTILEDRVIIIQDKIGITGQSIENELSRALNDSVERASGMADSKFNEYMASAGKKQSEAFDEFLLQQKKSIDECMNVINEVAKQSAKLRAETEAALGEMDGLRGSALSGLNVELKALYDEVSVGMNEKLLSLKQKNNEEYEKLASLLNENFRAAADEHNTKWMNEFTALNEKLNAWSESIRTEFGIASESFTDLKNETQEAIANIKKSTEVNMDSEIGKIKVLREQSFRKQERDIEDGIKSISENLQSAIALNTEKIEKVKTESEEFVDQAEKDILKTKDALQSLGEDFNAIENKIVELNAQSKIFTSAENTKRDLERKIEDMKSDIERINQDQIAITTIEDNIEKIKHIESDVNTKMGRFIQAEARISRMEPEFERLINLSAQMEEKKQYLESSNDKIDSMFLTLSKLNEAVSASEEKIGRIESKEEILDRTSDAISKNFTNLEKAETQTKAIFEKQNSLSTAFDEIARSFEIIKTENANALKTRDAMQKLDGELSNIEKRIDEVQVARKWLSETETRLNKTYSDIKGTLDLLAMNANPGGKQKGPSSLLPERRATIIRLHFEEGWTIPQLAAFARISESEVQLIIETANR
jgi:DNA repair exonuclease SbcCD ATPase subunit